MSTKRFFDKEILPKNWRKLPLEVKETFHYLWMNCDASGVWEFDYDLFEFENNFKLDSSYLEALGNLVVIFSEKVLLVDFIKVNYTNPKPNYNPHKPCFRAIEKNGYNLYEGLGILIENGEKNKSSIIPFEKYFKLGLSLNKACLKLIDEDIDKDEDKDDNTVETRQKDFIEFPRYDKCQMYNYKELPDEFKKMYDEDTWIRWQNLNKYLDDNCPFIRKIEIQMAIHQFVDLREKYVKTGKITNEKLLEIIQKLDNHKPATEKYNKFYEALLGWLKNESNWSK